MPLKNFIKNNREKNTIMIDHDIGKTFSHTESMTAIRRDLQ